MEIKLTQRMIAIVDDEDAWVNNLKWHVVRFPKHVYAQHVDTVDGKQRKTLMHRLIVGAKPGERVYHINRNGLDNRRVNLVIFGRPPAKTQ